ncbi:MAG: hypothetical protein JWP48_7402 [Actinoallomurus sp.]|nr:hypothetical protein [Actinoallomurus sp.]
MGLRAASARQYRGQCGLRRSSRGLQVVQKVFEAAWPAVCGGAYGSRAFAEKLRHGIGVQADHDAQHDDLGLVARQACDQREGVLGGEGVQRRRRQIAAAIDRLRLDRGLLLQALTGRPGGARPSAGAAGGGGGAPGSTRSGFVRVAI